MRNTHKPIHPTNVRQLASLQIQECLQNPQNCPQENLDLLRQRPFAIIKQLAEENQSQLLRQYLSEPYITEDICRRFLAEHPSIPLAIRLTLMQALIPTTENPSTKNPSTKNPSSKNPSSPSMSSGQTNPTASTVFPANLPRPEAAVSVPDSQQNSTEAIPTRIRHDMRTLSVLFPFLRIPLSAMELQSTSEISTFGTDGAVFYWNPSMMSTDVRPNRKDLQHMVIHCLYRHLIPPAQFNLLYWNIAADLAAEYLRTQLFPSVSHGVDREAQRMSFIFSEFPDTLYPGNAHAVYQWLCGNTSAQECQALARIFCRDDHSLWNVALNQDSSAFSASDSDGGGGDNNPQDSSDSGMTSCSSQKKKQMLASMWQEAREMTSLVPHKSRRGQAPGSRREKMILREEAQYDFRRYLQRYSTIREEMQLDMDSFDYIPYHYGLQVYGNMPLLEPLEYTEAHKVEQLVIAIDTSGSCDTPTVQRFLAEVQGILTNHANFFRKMEVHILQCDSYVHEHKAIHSVEEWRDYIQNIEIRGRGGTDFNPVFRYVEKLKAEGSCKRLKGLLYFTDGDGVYPKTPTSYETAFIFSNYNFLKFNVPGWIVKLCLDDPAGRKENP